MHETKLVLESSMLGNNVPTSVFFFAVISSSFLVSEDSEMFILPSKSIDGILETVLEDIHLPLRSPNDTHDLAFPVNLTPACFCASR